MSRMSRVLQAHTLHYISCFVLCLTPQVESNSYFAHMFTSQLVLYENKTASLSRCFQYGVWLE